ncbi:MAG: hypothetical protein ACKOX6_11005 [Bdellovibrio sp.]
MKIEKLKTPADYEIFSFRTTKEEKEKLNGLIESVVIAQNKRRKDGERQIRKNDVIMEALEKGLSIMKKTNSK